MDDVVLPAERYLRSSFYERLVEHVFISELLQEAWFQYGKPIEVLRPEVDNSGYDVVLECAGVMRHVQLKTSAAGGRAARQLVNLGLAEKAGGCVVWLVRDEDATTGRMRLRYRFFGGPPGEPLPPIAELAIAKHAKANARGIKTERPAIRVLPGARFEAIDSVGELLQRLFGIRDPAPEPMNRGDVCQAPSS